ncbi:hypothetical protein [Arthrobacter koreensis]|uniref:hypothetical protein n=1 Tax=Arthrobacter koreensis TaxID=199136 RepID=UPI002DB608AA|nr:hypothetical protein [Arthrobacter koreensis]MEB7504079.1 hypothetical protein [Arthrobacter koreensis]
MNVVPVAFSWSMKSLAPAGMKDAYATAFRQHFLVQLSPKQCCTAEFGGMMGAHATLS